MVVSDFHPYYLLGEMTQFYEHIFQMGWFNHQPATNEDLNKLIRKENTSIFLEGYVRDCATAKAYVVDTIN